jgi:hypothetical protein
VGEGKGETRKFEYKIEEKKKEKRTENYETGFSFFFLPLLVDFSFFFALSHAARGGSTAAEKKRK